MKIKGFLAGLGIAGKVGLGIGVAAAATTGAGATGMLPFSIPGVGHSGGQHTGAAVTTTTLHSVFATQPGAHVAKSPTHAHATHPVVVITPTTVEASTPTTTYVPPQPTPETTPTTVTPPTTVYGPTPPTTDTTPTTQPPNGQPIQLSCAVTGATQVTCSWTTASTSVAKYALWRWTTGGNGSDYAPIYQSADGLGFVDNNANPGTPYTYRVFTTLGDGTSGPVSNRTYLSCCS